MEVRDFDPHGRQNVFSGVKRLERASSISGSVLVYTWYLIPIIGSVTRGFLRCKKVGTFYVHIHRHARLTYRHLTLSGVDGP